MCPFFSYIQNETSEWKSKIISQWNKLKAGAIRGTTNDFTLQREEVDNASLEMAKIGADCQQ